MSTASIIQFIRCMEINILPVYMTTCELLNDTFWPYNGVVTASASRGYMDCANQLNFYPVHKHLLVHL